MKKAATLLLLPFLVSSLHAETYYLKNGEKYVGKKVSDDGKMIEIVYETEPGVKAWKTFKRVDIKKITREDIEAAMMLDILKLKETPDLQKPEWYQEQITKLIKPYYKEFKLSRNEAEVIRIEKALIAEHDVIKAGGVKINGKVLQPDEREAAAYDVDSSIIAYDFKVAKKKGKFGKAFDAADKLGLDFPKSAAYGEVVVELPKLARKYKSILILTEEERARNEAAWMKRKGSLTQAQIKAFMVEQADIKRQYDAIINKEKEAGKKWLTVNPNDKASIAGELAKVNAYLENVEKLVENYQQVDAGKYYKIAYEAIQAKDFPKAKEALSEMSRLGMNEGYFGKIDELYREEKDIEKQRKRLEEYYGKGAQIPPLDLYLIADSNIIDTLYECTQELGEIKDEAAAKHLRVRLRVLGSRLNRIMKRRSEYPPLDPADMETQNAELAISLPSSIEALHKNKELALKNKEFIGFYKEPLDNFIAAIPDPESFLSDRTKLALKKQKEAALLGKLDETAVATALQPHLLKIKEDKLTLGSIEKTSFYMLYFAASDSPSCQKDLPKALEAYEKVIFPHAHVDFIMFDRSEDIIEGKKWAKENKFPWSMIPRAVSNEYQTKWNFLKHKGNILPEYILVDKDGELVKKGKIAELMEEVEKGVEELRKKSEGGLHKGLTKEQIREQVKSNNKDKKAEDTKK